MDRINVRNSGVFVFACLRVGDAGVQYVGMTNVLARLSFVLGPRYGTDVKPAELNLGGDADALARRQAQAVIQSFLDDESLTELANVRDEIPESLPAFIREGAVAWAHAMRADGSINLQLLV